MFFLLNWTKKFLLVTQFSHPVNHQPMKKMEIHMEDFIFNDKKDLRDYDPGFTAGFNNKDESTHRLEEGVKKMADLQEKLYAHDKYSVLLIFQAMDAAGKDGTIKHVMSGVNPQGCQVKSFKAPSSEELDHDYLWRCNKALPEKGNIGIFNRSYYEEVVITQVHPEILGYQKLWNYTPEKKDCRKILDKRYDDINNYEKYLSHNGMVILKFFLNVSKEEQKNRFLSRINDPRKNWKFTMNDIKERQYWDKYMEAFNDTFHHTSTTHSPWYIIPADKKWFMRMAVCEIIVNTLKSLDLKFPEISEIQKKELLKAKEVLESEKKQ